MKKINQKRIEKKKKKRKVRIEKFKSKSSDPTAIRDSHTSKTTQEVDEYMRFIKNSVDINPTNELTQAKLKAEQKEVEQEEVEEKIESTDTILPQSVKEGIGDIKKRKQGSLERLRRSFYRKWPDNIIDLLFNIPSTIIISILVAWVSYYLFLKHDINELRGDISNKDGDMRKALVSDTAVKVLDSLSDFIDLKILSNNQQERVYLEKMMDSKIEALPQEETILKR